MSAEFKIREKDRKKVNRTFFGQSRPRNENTEFKISEADRKKVNFKRYFNLENNENFKNGLFLYFCAAEGLGCTKFPKDELQFSVGIRGEKHFTLARALLVWQEHIQEHCGLFEFFLNKDFNSYKHLIDPKYDLSVLRKDYEQGKSVVCEFIKEFCTENEILLPIHLLSNEDKISSTPTTSPSGACMML